MIRLALILASGLTAATLAPSVPAALRTPPPEPAALLSRATEASEQAYYGKMIEVQWYGRQARAAEIQIFSKPGGMLRREIHAHGTAQGQLAVSDGETEWIVLPAQKRAFKGAPSHSEPKRISPEDERALLLKNYTVKVRGQEEVAGRKAWVLNIDPIATGKPSQSLWIDQQTGLILRSKRYRSNGSLESLSQFAQIMIPAEIPDEMFAWEPPKGYTVEDHGLSPQFLSLQGMKDAVAATPDVPQALPGGFEFESAGAVTMRGQSVLHMRYTDGLLTVSLFQSPVPVRLKELATAPGEGRLPGGRVLQWKAGRKHYVLIGDLPQSMMRRLALEFKDLKKSDRPGAAGLKK